LAAPFEADHVEPRRESKASLQKSMKFTVDPAIPLLGMVARIDQQKGVDLLAKIIPELMNRQTVQMVVLGSGDEALLRELDHHAKDYPDQIRLCTEFNDPLAHHIYGGCDLFLMPSRFEPCGLGQMISMRYGAIPVVANTGGLHDTVRPAAGNSGTGFLFQPGNASAFLDAIYEALTLYADKPAWTALQRRAMNEDFSWAASMPAYLEAYRRALGRKPGMQPPSQSKIRKTR
jgi:starch synthase